MKIPTFYTYIYKVFCLAITLGIAVTANAQHTYIIEDFSEAYYVKVEVDSLVVDSELTSVRFHVLEKHTHKKMTSSVVDWSTSYLRRQLPKGEGTGVAYKDQSWFLYEDVNFDGIKDYVLPHTYIVPFSSIPAHGFMVFEGDGEGKFLYNADFSTKIRSMYPSKVSLDRQEKKWILQQNKYDDLESYDAVYEIRENKALFLKSRLEYQHQPYSHHTEVHYTNTGTKEKVDQYKRYSNKKEEKQILRINFPEMGVTARLSAIQDRMYLMLEQASGKIEEVYFSFYFTEVEEERALYFDDKYSALVETEDGEVSLIWREDEVAIVKGDLHTKQGGLKDVRSFDAKNITSSYRITPPASDYFAELFPYDNSENKENAYSKLGVFHRPTAKQVLLEDFVRVNLKNKPLKTNTSEWLYEQQDLFRIGDFNFDQQTDIVIHNKEEQGAQVYLNQEGKLVYSPEFSAILTDNRSWELVNSPTSPYIITNLEQEEKDTWIQSEEKYTLINGLPWLLSSKSKNKSEDGTMVYILEYREHAEDQLKKEEKEYLYFEDGGLKEWFSMAIPKQGLKISLLQYQKQLKIALVDEKAKIQGELYGRSIGKETIYIDYSPDAISMTFGLERENSIVLEGRKLLVKLEGKEQEYTWEKSLKKRERKQLEQLLHKSFENVQIRTHYLEIPNSNYYALIQNFASFKEDMEETARVLIIDRESEQTLLEQMLYMRQLPDELLTVNEHEFPYGAHSLIMYEDFNFDGEKDLAILDGFHSCYSGPSYQVYLATENGFEWNEGFSELGQFYCGMFKVNKETKTLETLAKSGCCWHEYSKFTVKNNQPYLIEQFVEDDREEQNELIIGNSYHYKEVEGEMVEIPSRKLNMELLTNDWGALHQNKMCLYFEFESGNKMFLFQHMENLFYAYTTADHKIIEFATFYNYPSTDKPYYHFTDVEIPEHTEKETLDYTEYCIYIDRVEISRGIDKEARIPLKKQVFPSASFIFEEIE